jgi:hypothetical protein
MWSANATNNFFIPQNLTTYFGPYGPSSGDNYRNGIQFVLFRIFSLYRNKTKILEVFNLQNPQYCINIY